MSINIEGNIQQTAKRQFVMQKTWKAAIQRLHALAMVATYMYLNKWKCLMKAFIMSHFNYYLLAWMFCSRKPNNRIIKIRERAYNLILTYNDNYYTFRKLLGKYNPKAIHYRNLHAKNIKELFDLKKPLRSDSSHFMKQKTKTWTLWFSFINP